MHIPLAVRFFTAKAFAQLNPRLTSPVTRPQAHCLLTKQLLGESLDQPGIIVEHPKTHQPVNTHTTCTSSKGDPKIQFHHGSDQAVLEAVPFEGIRLTPFRER